MSKYPKGKNLSVWAGLILCMVLGFVFVVIGTGVEPVEREELDAVTIRLGRCAMIPGDYDHISLLDEEGNRYGIHAANGDQALAERLKELPAGTELELLLHPQEEYVLGIYRDGTPLLGWQRAMQEIRDEERGFFWLGIGMWVCGAVIFITEKSAKKKK